MAVLQHSNIEDFTAPPPLDLSRNALFLDLDGTLVDFAAHPEHVIASEDLRALLRRLSDAMNGAVALITGRTIASADAVLGGALLNVAGVHGFERRASGSTERVIADLSPVSAAVADARAMVASHAFNADIEDKGGALALHYRREPRLAESVRQVAAELALRHGLKAIEGKMVVELKLSNRTKADAVTDFMNTDTFSCRQPIAVGDDVTDEDAFRAVATFGGDSILVGEPRRSAARWRLVDTQAVNAWLLAAVAQ